MSYTRPPNAVVAGVALIQNPPASSLTPPGAVPVTLDAAIATTTSLGVVQVGAGLAITPAGVLSATGSGGAYSFGPWTPTLVPTAGSISIAVLQAKYVKVGQLVTCTFDIKVTGFTGGASSNTVKLGGLPFTSLNDNQYVGSVFFALYVDMNSNVDYIAGTVDSNSTTADIRFSTTQAQNMYPLKHGDLKINTQLVGTVTYLSAT